MLLKEAYRIFPSGGDLGHRSVRFLVLVALVPSLFRGHAILHEKRPPFGWADHSTEQSECLVTIESGRLACVA